MLHFNTHKKTVLHRKLILDAYRNYIKKTLPKNGTFFTLCADCTVENSELQYFTDQKLIAPNQYVGVDADKKIIERNKQIVGPEWLSGSFNEQLGWWLFSNSKRKIAVCNADYMCTYNVGMSNIENIFCRAGNSNSFTDKCLIAINGLAAAPRLHYTVEEDEIRSNLETFARKYNTGLHCVSDNTAYRKGSAAYTMVPFIFIRR